MFQTAFQPNAFQNNAFQIVITLVTPTQTGGDGWTKEEWRRAIRFYYFSFMMTLNAIQHKMLNKPFTGAIYGR